MLDHLTCAHQVFDRLARGIAAIEKEVKKAGYEFAYNEHLGFIHSCPTVLTCHPSLSYSSQCCRTRAPACARVCT